MPGSRQLIRRPRSLNPEPQGRHGFGWPQIRRHRETVDVALVVELLARELRGGATLAAAVGAIDPAIDPGLADVPRRVDQGASLGDELDRWSAGLPEGDGVMVRAVLRLGLVTGAALADALDRVAVVIHERRDLAGELRALSAQSRASASMIAAAPPAFLLVFGIADPGGISMLVTSPLGWLCLVGGGTLDIVGFWWMRRLVGAIG